MDKAFERSTLGGDGSHRRGGSNGGAYSGGERGGNYENGGGYGK